jgi:threonine dehydrogenase-like Zn-dependent dehydrogenase
MLGICFEKIQSVRTQPVSEPILESETDAIVQVQVAGLCGSDLHPYMGREVGLDPGTVMGHEFVGEVIAVGNAVEKIRIGDRVCAPFSTNCGTCFYCQRGLTARCVQGQLFGWRTVAKGLHGGQSERVRVPLADGTLLPLPSEISSDVGLLLGDNLSTGFFAADQQDIRPDGVYAVIGCGTVGLLAIASAIRLGATQIVAVDLVESRLEMARSLGAIGFSNPMAAETDIMARTEGRGADGIMELVGLPDAQRLAYRLIRPGGVMSVIGCHCTENFAFSPVDAYDKNLTFRSGRCSARHYMPLLIDSLRQSPMDLSWCITHRFPLDQSREAYDVFSNRLDGCVKAVIEM